MTRGRQKLVRGAGSYSDRGQRKTPERESHFAERGSGFKEGSHLRLIDFLYHSTLGCRVIQKINKAQVS